VTVIEKIAIPRRTSALAAILASAVAALAARALWPGERWSELALLFALIVSTGAALAALRSVLRPPARLPDAEHNLLARQLSVSAREAEVGRFQRFAKDAPIGIVFVGRDGHIRFANDEFLRIVGRSRAELELERFGPDAAARTRWLHDEPGSRHESEYVRDDGTRVPVMVALSRQEDGVAAFLVDLTAEKAALRAREESEARFRALAEKLAETDRRKNEFLGMLSHELRNPLAPIRNSVFILRRAASYDPALLDRTLAIVDRQVEHLTRLVDDLLDVTRITRGKVELRREQVALGDLLRRTAEDHRALAAARQVELRLDVPDLPAVVDGDPTRLMQIVGNLLQNAIKFSSPGKAVALSLSVRTGDGRAEIRVHDEGAGIDPALLAHVFEPFVQGERTLARSAGGLGLGLALVKALSELHGGTCAAESEGPGHGATFTITLPLARAEEAGHAPAPRLRAATPQRASRVLVVEDNQDVAASLRDLVEAFGHEVQVARSGDSALAAARERPPDVVLCDIGLPGMSGYDVARAFRRDPSLRHARLVAVTGYAQAEDKREAAEAGFDRHVGKPPDPSELERLLG
jgi:PAS domain S-box-containing protein